MSAALLAVALGLVGCADGSLDPKATSDTGKGETDTTTTDTEPPDSGEDTAPWVEPIDTAASAYDGDPVEDAAIAKITGPPADFTYEWKPEIAIAGGSDLDGDGLPDIGMWYFASLSEPYTTGFGWQFSGLPTGTTTYESATHTMLGQPNECFGYDAAYAAPSALDATGGFLLGAPCWVPEDSSSFVGRVYLVRGELGASVGTEEVETWFEGPTTWTDYSAFGEQVADAGDVNGDGYTDYLFLANDARIAYLVNGPVSGQVMVDTQAAATISEFYGLYPGGVDADGDGLDDVMLTLPFRGEERVAELYLAPVSGTLTEADSDRSVVSSEDSLRAEPRWIGDVDADGRPDLAAVPGDGVADKPLRILADPLNANNDIALASIQIEPGEAKGRYFGGYFEGGNDLDLDGKDDLVIAASQGNDDGGHGGGPGYLYTFLAPFEGVMSADDAARTLHGSHSDNLGSQFASVGDVDGDAIPDLMVTAPGDREHGPTSGATWLLSGAALY